MTGRIYDITLTVTPALPVWPGDPRIVVERVMKMEEGEDANVSRVAMSAHAGTHVDAPYHFVADGYAVEDLPLEALIGPAVVVEMADSGRHIDLAALEAAGIPAGAQRLLFKTRNSRAWAEQRAQFQEDFVAIAPDGAQWLVDHGVLLVGVDYLSVAPFDDPAPTHRILLDGRVVALEGVDLSDVPAGRYTLICLPLKLGGSDGAPARAVLISEAE